MGHAPTMGRFQYLDASVESSLYRNGKVLTQRDEDGSDSDQVGVDFFERQMPVHNARGTDGAPTLWTQGFELQVAPSKAEIAFLDHKQVVQRYYPECAEIVAAATGASYVFAFDHNVRSATGNEQGRRVNNGQRVQGPAHVAHGDYTLRSGPERFEALALPPTGNDTLSLLGHRTEPTLDPQRVRRALSGELRYAIINLWRNIAEVPVAKNPLALCDARTLAPQELVVFEVHYQDRVGENYFCKHSTLHRWSYFPAMTADEALLIKQWDSAGTLARTRGERSDADDPHAPSTFSLHSAFDDPSTDPGAPDRWSVEVRCAVIYD